MQAEPGGLRVPGQPELHDETVSKVWQRLIYQHKLQSVSRFVNTGLLCPCWEPSSPATLALLITTVRVCVRVCVCARARFSLLPPPPPPFLGGPGRGAVLLPDPTCSLFLRLRRAAAPQCWRRHQGLGRHPLVGRGQTMGTKDQNEGEGVSVPLLGTFFRSLQFPDVLQFANSFHRMCLCLSPGDG